MSLVPWKNKRGSLMNPISSLDLIHNDLDRLFGSSVSNLFDNGFIQNSLPCLDLYESADNLIVKVDLPGLEKDEIDVSIQSNLLTIKGEKKHEEEIKDMGVLKSERFHGNFERVVSLPTDKVDTKKIKALYGNGVLELRIPKTEEDKPKKINVDIQ